METAIIQTPFTQFQLNSKCSECFQLMNERNSINTVNASIEYTIQTIRGKHMKYTVERNLSNAVIWWTQGNGNLTIVQPNTQFQFHWDALDVFNQWRKSKDSTYRTSKLRKQMISHNEENPYKRKQWSLFPKFQFHSNVLDVFNMNEVVLLFIDNSLSGKCDGGWNSFLGDFEKLETFLPNFPESASSRTASRG